MNKLDIIAQAKEKRCQQALLDQQLRETVEQAQRLALGVDGVPSFKDATYAQLDAQGGGVPKYFRDELLPKLRALLDAGANPDTHGLNALAKGMTQLVNLALSAPSAWAVAGLLLKAGAVLDNQSAVLIAQRAAQHHGAQKLFSFSLWKQDHEVDPLFKTIATLAAATPGIDWNRLVDDESKYYRIIPTTYHPTKVIRAGAAVARHFPEFDALLEEHYKSRGEPRPMVLPDMGITPKRATEELVGFLRADSRGEPADELLDRDEKVRRARLWLAAGANPNGKVANKYGGFSTAMQLAARFPSQELFGVLVEHGGCADQKVVEELVKVFVDAGTSLQGGVFPVAHTPEERAEKLEKINNSFFEILSILEQTGAVDLEQYTSYNPKGVASMVSRAKFKPACELLAEVLPGFEVKYQARKAANYLDDHTPQPKPQATPQPGKRRL